MDVIGLVGRVIFSMMFVMSGMNHLSKRRYMTEYARQMGSPNADAMVPLTGVTIVAGGVMTALGIWGDLGALLIAAFLLPTAYYMHGFWRLEEEQKQEQQIHFMKNVTMAGGALTTMALFLCDGVGLTLTGPLFG